MAILTTENSGIVTITLDSRFVFSEHQAFQQTYKNRPPKTRYIIDFKRVNYMDSSALGMLLVLKEHNGPEGKELLKIINCNPQIKKIFEIANFAQLFTIE
ncbi:MAG: STAS domain-containing protein [Magnetococcus sp. YQC-5]